MSRAHGPWRHSRQLPGHSTVSLRDAAFRRISPHWAAWAAAGRVGSAVQVGRRVESTQAPIDLAMVGEGLDVSGGN